jgi:hypothetical protein
MNKTPNTLREDNVFKLKIILLIVYLVLTILMILMTNGSASDLLSQLFLQIGNVLIDASPSQVKS